MKTLMSFFCFVLFWGDDQTMLLTGLWAFVIKIISFSYVQFELNENLQRIQFRCD